MFSREKNFNNGKAVCLITVILSYDSGHVQFQPFYLLPEHNVHSDKSVIAF